MPVEVVNGEVILNGDVGADFCWSEQFFTSMEVRRALPQSGPVTIRLNSGGGSAWEGAAIHSILKSHRGDVTVLIEGIAASAASFLAMAADQIIMSRGSVMMIHDPASITMGTEEQHRDAAEALGVVATEYAALYAARAGISEEEARAIMIAETWYGPQAAVDAGFADQVADSDAAIAASFPYQIYSKAPASLKKDRSLRVLEERIAASLAVFAGVNTDPEKPEKEGNMPDDQKPGSEKTALKEDKPAVVAETPKKITFASNQELFALAERNKLTMSQAALLMANPITITEAKAKILDMKAEEDTGSEIVNASAEVTSDGVDRFREGATKALMQKARMKGGERNEFSSFTLRELGNHSLRMRNLKPGASRAMESVSMAFVPTMAGGLHSTSDFGEILKDVAEKAMMMGFEEAEETFQMWTRSGTASDFKPQSRVGLNAFPSLRQVPAGAEYKYATMGDFGEQIVVATYGEMFSISRQAIINDDLNAFTDVPRKMGRAAIRTVGNLVFAILNDNPNMSDGNPLFDAAHSNLGTAGAPTVSSFNEAYELMGSQSDRSGSAVALNVRPEYGIFPISLRGTTLQVLQSEHDPAKTSRSANTAREMVMPIFDNRLSGGAWYFAANPSSVDTIEVAYLDGEEAPFLDQQDGWGIDGSEFKVRIDAGVKALAWEGLFKNAGAS